MKLPGWRGMQARAAGRSDTETLREPEEQMTVPAAQRITFRSLGTELVRAVSGVESRWLGTVGGLLRNAGATVRDYVEGMRSPYAHPIGYALACISAYVLARQWLLPEGSLAALFDPVLLLGALWPYCAFLLLVPAAWLMRSLYRRVGVNAAECYVLMLYVAGQLALTETAWTIANALLPLPDGLVWAVRGLQALYAAGAVVQFTGVRTWTGWLRAVATVAGTTSIFYGAMYAFIAYAVRSLLG